MGYNKSFFSNIFHQEGKFFNLEHIEKICHALNYSISQLFAEVEYKADEQRALGVAEPPGPGYGADDITEKILIMLEGMEEEKRRDVLKYIEEKKLLTELLEERKKKGAA